MIIWLAFIIAAQANGQTVSEAELPRIPPRAPEEELRSFRLAEGFRIELAAAEPLVIDPVAMEFDENGRLYVVEMRDYPFTTDPDNLTTSDEARSQPSGRVRLIEDADGDGRADRSTVFADRFHWPTALALWKGGVFVAAAPDIFYLRDEDGDGTADTRKVVWTGFNRHNVQALVNGLKWGLDNKIYIANGGNGGNIAPGDGPRAKAVSISGRDLRFNPAGGPLELIPGGGQFGLSFDSWGQRFVCSNSVHAIHVVFSGPYLDRNPYLPARRTLAEIAVDGGAAPVFRTSAAEPWRLVRTRWRASSPEASRYPPTELFPIGFFTSATGITLYRGGLFPEEFENNVLVGDVGGNLLHRKVLEPSGATFIARRPEKELKAEFLTSTDNWFRPVNLAEGPDGALYVLDMYRETIEHPYSIPDSLKRHLSLTSGNDRGRIWRIAPEGHRPGEKPALASAPTAELVKLLEHRNAWWRFTAQRLLFERRDPQAAPPLRRLSRESTSPLGRIHALGALDGLGCLALEEIESALRDPHPRVREQALVLAEPRLERAPSILQALLPLSGDADPRVRFQLALVLGAIDHPQASEALERLAERDGSDPWMQSAILSSAAKSAGALFAALAGKRAGGEPAPATPFLGPLAEVIGARGEAAEIAAVLESELAARALSGLGAGLERSGKSLSELLENPPPSLQGAAAKIAAVFQGAAPRAIDPKLGAEERVGAAGLLAHAPFAVAAPALEKLFNAQTPQALQLKAVQALSGQRHDGVAELFLSRWTRFSPAVRREVLEALFQRPERLSALLDALAAGSIPPRDLDPDRKRQLLGHPEAKIRERAQALFAQDLPSDRKEVFERLKPALSLQGDAARGREIYRQKCATCHRLGNEGFAVGPDLATIQSRMTEAILQQILDPNREMLPMYTNYLVITRDGRTMTGLIASETATSIVLRRAEGAEDAVLRSNIRDLQSSGQSLMPEDLEKDLTPQDVADLLACLRG